MKRVLFAGLLMVAVSAACFARELVATGKTHTAMGDYKLEVTDPVIINNEEFKAFMVTYANSPMQVKIVVMKGKNCKDYVVMSDKLSIKYVCNKDYFGVEKLNNSITGLTTSDEALDRTQYYHQRKISDGGNTENESARLIAAFFPLLLKEEAAGAI